MARPVRGRKTDPAQMSSDLSLAKATLRARQNAANKSISASDRTHAAQLICDRFKELDVWHRARAILFFAPLPDEPDIWPLVIGALAAGKTVTLPRHSKADQAYHAAQVLNLSTDLRNAHLGIREPVPDCPAFPLNQLDLVLVPGVAWSGTGYRLGRGKGYYDRLLAAVSGVKLGIAFDWQFCDTLPVEPHDIRLNCMLTPTRWLVFERRAVIK